MELWGGGMINVINCQQTGAPTTVRSVQIAEGVMRQNCLRVTPAIYTRGWKLLGAYLGERSSRPEAQQGPHEGAKQRGDGGGVVQNEAVTEGNATREL